MHHCASEVIVPARSTRSVETEAPEPRHARLFELIRQENLSSVLSVHIDNQCEVVEAHEVSDAVSHAFLKGAERSLEQPAQAA